MGNKINTVRVETHLTEEDTCRVEASASDLDKKVIMRMLGTLEPGYLKKLTDFKRVDNPDGSADFSIKLSLNK